MRVVIAPDKFAGTLSAVQAAEAIAAGWHDTSPRDELVTVPLSDGGTGFVDVIHAALRDASAAEAAEAGSAPPGNAPELRIETVTGPDGSPVPAAWLLAGTTAYVESAQACGLHLVEAAARDAPTATSYGVGELIAAALDLGARRIVVGLGGTATTDGGGGMLAALADRYGVRVPDALRGGGAGLAALGDPDAEPVELDALRAALPGAGAPDGGIELVAASDVDNPLTGIRGAAAIFGPQKGASADDVQRLDAALTTWLRHAEHIPPDAGRMRKPIAERPGAGAGGGLGYALFLLGAERVPGIATVAAAVGLADHVAGADLVLTGEGGFDFQSLHGKVVSGVADIAGSHGRPCVVLAGKVEVGRREMAAMGVEAAYSVTELAGSAAAAMAHPDTHLRALAARVCRTWSPA